MNDGKTASKGSRYAASGSARALPAGILYRTCLARMAGAVTARCLTLRRIVPATTATTRAFAFACRAAHCARALRMPALVPAYRAYACGSYHRAATFGWFFTYHAPLPPVTHAIRAAFLLPHALPPPLRPLLAPHTARRRACAAPAALPCALRCCFAFASPRAFTLLHARSSYAALHATQRTRTPPLHATMPRTTSSLLRAPRCTCGTAKHCVCYFTLPPRTRCLPSTLRATAPAHARARTLYRDGMSFGSRFGSFRSIFGQFCYISRVWLCGGKVP